MSRKRHSKTTGAGSQTEKLEPSESESDFKRIQPDVEESISEDENPLKLSQADQIQLIQQTGILSRIPMSKPSQINREPPPKPLLEFAQHEIRQDSTTSEIEEEGSTDEDETKEPDTLPIWVDKAFDTFLWTVPFSTVFICL